MLSGNQYLISCFILFHVSEFHISGFPNTLSNSKRLGFERRETFKDNWERFFFSFLLYCIRERLRIENANGRLNGHLDLLPYKARLGQGQPFHADVIWEGGTMPDHVCPRVEVNQGSTSAWLPLPEWPAPCYHSGKVHLFVLYTITQLWFVFCIGNYLLFCWCQNSMLHRCAILCIVKWSAFNVWERCLNPRWKTNT